MQTLPCNKEEFSRVVKDLNFMNGSDRGFVDKKFAETSEQILGAATELVRENVTRATAEEWSVLLTATMPKYMNRLVKVNLRFNPLIQGVSLEVFAARAGTLEVLQLTNCPGFTGSLEPLRCCKKLRALDLSGCVQLEGGLEPLAGLGELWRVELECCFGLTGDLAPLCGLKKLKVLNVCDTNLEGATTCLLYTSPSPRDMRRSRMPSSA